MSDELDIFGKFLMGSLRDRVLDDCESLLQGKYKALELQELQQRLGELTATETDLLKQVVKRCIDTGIHDFLFRIQEQTDLDGPVKVVVNGINIADLSDGLHGELFTEDGWFARFSKPYSE